jgi:hypothetical protein
MLGLIPTYPRSKGSLRGGRIASQRASGTRVIPITRQTTELDFEHCHWKGNDKIDMIINFELASVE